MVDYLPAFLIDRNTGEHLIAVPGGWTDDLAREIVSSPIMVFGSMRFWVEPARMIRVDDVVIQVEIPAKRLPAL